MPRAADPLDGLRAARLTAHRLAAPAASATEAVSSLLAMQAQDHDGSLWSIGRRTAGVDRGAIEAALAAGELVRSWPIRGTLHVVAARDLRPLLALTRERTTAAAAGIHRRLGIDDAAIDRAAEAARERLTGTRLPRRELLEHLAGSGVSVEGGRGAQLVVRLAQDGVIVLVGHREVALADEVLPPADPVERSEALVETARRYVAGHGPTTARDLAWWAGLTLADARAGFAGIRDESAVTTLDGVEHLAPVGLEPAAPSVIALSGFDEWMLGYSDRRAALGANPLERVVPGANGLFLPTVLVDGRVAATWRRERHGNGDRVVLDPWERIPSTRMPAVRRAIRERAAFDGWTVTAID